MEAKINVLTTAMLNVDCQMHLLTTRAAQVALWCWHPRLGRISSYPKKGQSMRRKTGSSDAGSQRGFVRHGVGVEGATRVALVVA
jgi:hypothetical protein